MTTNSIVARIEESRKELLQLDLRNPLLNYRYLRARGVEAVDEAPSRVFDALVRKSRTVAFAPRPDDIGSPLQKKVRNTLQTSESERDLSKRLLNTYYNARTIIEEQGVNTLFLALGMVLWYEDDTSDVERRAPLILVPVKIDRESIRAGFRIEHDGEDIEANLSFMAKARADFGIDIPGLHKSAEEDDDEIDVNAYFRSVSRSIAGMRRWSVDNSSVVLGFFSFSKFLMYRDLDTETWPDENDNKLMYALYGDDGFREPELNIGAEDHLDSHLSPKDVHHVVDADSSQSLAIEDMKSGRSLVIQGPPGTGKSQTITNIIAEAVGLGRKVLFVSEKMAALEVVKRRLDSIHLGDACLELHSNKTTKSGVLNELKRTHQLGRPDDTGIDDDFDTLARVRGSLNKYSNVVNSPVGETGVTPYHAYGEYLRIKRREDVDTISLPQIKIKGSDSWTNAEFNRKREEVERLQVRIPPIGVPKEHPFWGTRRTSLLPSDRDDLQTKLVDTTRSIGDLEEVSVRLAETLRLRPPDRLARTEDLADVGTRIINAPDISGLALKAPQWDSFRKEIAEFTDVGKRWSELRGEYESMLLPEAWDADVLEIRQTLRTTGRKFWRFLSSDFRQANKILASLCRTELDRDIERRIELVERILEDQRMRRRIKDLSAQVGDVFGSRWRGKSTDWKALHSDVTWFLNLLTDVDNGTADPDIVESIRARGSDSKHKRSVRDLLVLIQADVRSYRDRVKDLEDFLEMDNKKRFGSVEGLSLLTYEDQKQILSTWSKNIAQLQDMTSYNSGIESLRDEELDAVAELSAGWPNAADHLVDCFDKVRYESVVSRAFSERPELVRFDFRLHETDIDRFRSMDLQALDHNRTRVALTHWKGLPGDTAAGQAGVLRREYNKKRRHLPIRQLITQAGDAIQAIKPVFMMSPMSIATYLPLDSVRFDLVVFDEASQVRPVDALGALLRADQAIVVGDSQQLPPTSFFSTIVESDQDDEAEESVTADMESILGLFDTKGAPSRMLRWHYRSRHDSLITVSNQEFYENGLVVFPSPDSNRQNLGLRYHHLPDTVYDTGGSRTNRGEARAVADSVMKHAAEHPDLTLGVAAFSSGQAQAILDELEMLRRQDPSWESFFNSHADEPFFIKNLENVQGDERDVIFISIGYGRDATCRIAMRFGPLNNDGGHRRLNVLITRAKLRCHVFANFQADDIDLSRTQSRGVKALKTFLEYAESGTVPAHVPIESGREVESPFQREVATRLREHGYEVHDEVASGGKFVDIGIVDPERPGMYLLGIECDGASYHSARSARDRDRLRETHLESLGWRLHRIWSTDWFRDPERALGRAIEAIEIAKFERSDGRNGNGRDKPETRSEIERLETGEQGRVPELRVYEMASLHVSPLDASSLEYASEPVAQVVRVESPVHIEEVMSRIARAVRVNKTKKVRASLLNAVKLATLSNRELIVRKGRLSVVGKSRTPDRC